MYECHTYIILIIHTIINLKAHLPETLPKSGPCGEKAVSGRAMEGFVSVEKKLSFGKDPLFYPLPVLLIASYDINDKPNVMTASWGGICNSEPLSLCVSIRPERWTHASILKRKAFTVGIASESMAKAADYVGMASGRNEDKFAVTGWTAVKARQVDAPYVGECPVVLECRLTNTLELGTHTMMIGAVEDTKVDEACLTGGHPDISKIAPLAYDVVSRGYYNMGEKVAGAFFIGQALLKNK